MPPPKLLTTRTLTILIVCLVLAVAAGVVASSSIKRSTPPENHSESTSAQPLITTPSNQAKISWSDPQMNITLSPGESGSRNLTFTSTLPLTNVVVEAVPEIASLLKIQPASFSNIPANQPQSVRINFSIAPSIALRSYDGTIHVRSGSLTPPQTLKVVLNVWPAFTDTTLGLTFKYPPTLYILRDQDKPAQMLIQSAAKEIVLGGALPEDPATPYTTTGYVVAISSNVYVKPFTINQYLEDTHPSSLVDTITNTIVSGVASYKVTFREEVGAGEPIIIIPLSDRVIEIAFSSTFSTGSSEEQDALRVYDQIVNSVLVMP